MAACFLLLSAVPSPAQVTPIRVETGGDPRLDLMEILRLGSEAGAADAFGRISDAVGDGRGRLFVADIGFHHVRVFDRSGRPLATLGREGRGPGEFQLPVTLAVDAADSLFVWDMGSGRISVFAPELRFVRSFQVPPSWVVSSIAPLADGNLLISGFTRNQPGALHRVDRAGVVRQTYPVGLQIDVDLALLYGYETSLLGGSGSVDGDRIAFASKSPYALSLLPSSGEAGRTCRGESGWTTQPNSVVARTGPSVSMAWNRYVHVTGIYTAAPGLYLLTIRDPVRDLDVIDLVTAGCSLVRRTELSGLMVHDVREDLLIASRVRDYPEIVVYRWRLAR